MSTENELVEALRRWEDSGGHWRVLSTDHDGHSVVFGLFTCDGGELMSQVSGSRTEALETFLAGRARSDN